MVKDSQNADGKSYKIRFGSYKPNVKKRFNKAPTEGLFHVIFDYNAANKDKNTFGENLKKLRQYIATSAAIKYGVPGVAKTVRTLVAPTFKNPTAPTKDKETKLYDKLEKETYFHDRSAVKAQKAQWEENNQKVYNLFLSHCTPNMETKLQGMET